MSRFIKYLLLYFFIIVTIPAVCENDKYIYDLELFITEAAGEPAVKAKLKSKKNISDQIIILSFNGKEEDIFFKNNEATIPANLYEEGLLFIYSPTHHIYKLYHLKLDKTHPALTNIPLWMSIIPPLIAIAFALIFQEVFVAIFSGILVGAFIAQGFSADSILISFVNVLDKYIINALYDKGHLSIIVFSMLIGGMVSIINKNGGMYGVVDKLARFANSPKNAQLTTWFLGIAIFFDDYANTLIVGNTMRPVTDKFNISREKLAYIVDSTAAPVAAIAFITTWIGAELGYIQDAIEPLGIKEGAYHLFFNSLQYMFYPILTLIFIFVLIISGKDYGKMHSVEQRQKHMKNVNSGDKNDLLSTDLKSNNHWLNAFIPIFCLVSITFSGLIITGFNASIWSTTASFFTKLSQTIGNADSYVALLWGSFAGLFAAILLTIAQRKMPLSKTMEEMLEGFKSMISPITILVLAWALAQLVEELHTAEFFLTLLQGNISAVYLPLIVFILSAGISFSTGSSWGTMAILYPFVIPVAWELSILEQLPHEEAMAILYNVVSVVLAGSVFGDHCSPISDTSILSSLSTQCNHIQHVKTQLPYAITVAIISLVIGGVLFPLQLHWTINYLIGIGLIIITIYVLGRKTIATD